LNQNFSKNKTTEGIFLIGLPSNRWFYELGKENPYDYLGEADLLIEKGKYKCKNMCSDTIPQCHTVTKNGVKYANYSKNLNKSLFYNYY
jgi:hypothetical protein